MVVLHSHLFPSPLPPFSLYNSASDAPPPINLRLPRTKPRTCTADELHFVPVSTSDWRLALWRYLPSPLTQPKNHPLLLLPGVGNNAIGFDLSPESSFARFMSCHGFETWILELRGAGLSALEIDNDKGQNSAITIQIKDLTQRFVNIIKEGRQSGNSFDFPDRVSNAFDDSLKQLELLLKYNWDFDNYLEEDLPAAMEYIKAQSKPKDEKLLAVGHSMGGMLLYSMLSRCGSEGRESGLSSVATLASSLDFRPSKSLLRLLLPVAEPVKTLNFPIFPIGPVVASARPYDSNPPNVFPWLNSLISAPGMMHPELFQKLVAENFGIVPSKFMLQLKTVFDDGGLKNRDGTLSYKENLGKSTVPVLAIAGDQDLICPPEAVYETAKMMPKHLVTFRVFGEPKGPHYAHYDLVGSHSAQHQVHPCIVDFLNRHDVYE